jgi:PAS domain S-box-containing protein
VLVDDGGTITYLNPSAEKMFGCRQEEGMGRPLHFLIVAEESRHKYSQALEDFQKSGRCKVIGKPMEGHALRRDAPLPGGIIHHRHADKGKRHSAGTVRDITARRSIEEKSRKRLGRLVCDGPAVPEGVA